MPPPQWAACLRLTCRSISTPPLPQECALIWFAIALVAIGATYLLVVLAKEWKRRALVAAGAPHALLRLLLEDGHGPLRDEVGLVSTHEELDYLFHAFDGLYEI